MNIQSIIQRRSPVTFPEWEGDRIYMRPFKVGDDLGKHTDTVRAMLDGVDTKETCYLMVDEALVKAGTFHRRPGKHIDGWWDDGLSAHNGSGPQHVIEPMHRRPPCPGHRSPFHAHSEGREEGIFLASNITACVGYAGVFDGEPREGGDCDHIDVSGMTPINMEAGVTFAGNVSMLHESTPVSFDCFRTVYRINVPHWKPH